MRKHLIVYFFVLLCGSLLSLSASAADPFIQKIERATPAQRVIHLLNYFDTCRAVTQHQAYAFRVLHEVDQLGAKVRDEQLRRYARYLKDTYAKHQQTNTQNATLFLTVGQRAADDSDPQIAAVCRHFAGQYYFLNEEYGKAFEHLLAANKAFRKIGYERIPEISHYLYELAFDYFHFAEYEKAIPLLEETTRHPAFNANLAVQTYNTTGMAHIWLAVTKDSAHFLQAERSFRKAIEAARRYGDSLWVGIATGNLAGVYENQYQWAKSLRYYLRSYQLGLKFGGRGFAPSEESLSIASLYLRLGRRDSCLYYLNRALHLDRLVPGSGNRFEDDYARKNYYDVARRYYKAIGDLPKAYAYSDSLMVVDKQINKRYNSERLSLVNQRLMIQQHQSEVAAIESEKKSQQTLFWLVAAGLTLLAALLFRLYYLSRLRRCQERVIEAEKETSLRLQKQIVEDELRQAQADLSSFVENLRQKDELIDTITAQLEERPAAPPPDGTTPPPPNARQDLIHSRLLTNDDWDEFRRRFERVHPGFFWRLKTQLPDLSPAEERLLALSQLRLDTRQMGRMLGISPNSIRTTRYRLRKKIGADGDSFLSKLLHDSPDKG